MYHRHLSARLKPEAGAIRRFRAMSAQYIKKISESIVQSLMESPEWDPIQALKEKSDFTRGKKIMYYSELLKALDSGKITPGAFMTMVKSGEVNYASHLDIDGVFLHGQSSRPRNIMKPSSSLCGLLTLIQNVLWKPVKKAEPGFIQGLTKDELKKAMLDGVHDHWRVICLDGSSFDSTQNSDVMSAVDDVFWTSIKPGLL